MAMQFNQVKNFLKKDLKVITHIRSLLVFEKCIFSMTDKVLSKMYKILEISSLVNDSIRQIWQRDCRKEILIQDWKRFLNLKFLVNIGIKENRYKVINKASYISWKLQYVLEMRD